MSSKTVRGKRRLGRSRLSPLAKSYLHCERKHPFPNEGQRAFAQAIWDQLSEEEHFQIEQEFLATFPKALVAEAVGRHWR